MWLSLEWQILEGRYLFLSKPISFSIKRVYKSMLHTTKSLIRWRVGWFSKTFFLLKSFETGTDTIYIYIFHLPEAGRNICFISALARDQFSKNIKHSWKSIKNGAKKALIPDWYIGYHQSFGLSHCLRDRKSKSRCGWHKNEILMERIYGL